MSLIIINSNTVRLLSTILFIGLIVSSCSRKSSPGPGIQESYGEETAQPSVNESEKFAKIHFDSSTYHFGAVKQGQSVSRKIHFRNIGNDDLVINLISACECTTIDWPRLPVKPGKWAVLDVRYDSKNKSGAQIIDIEILANTNPEISYTKYYIFVEP